MSFRVMNYVCMGDVTNQVQCECLINPPHQWYESYLIYNQINYKDMKIVINGNNNKWKDTYGNKANI